MDEYPEYVCIVCRNTKNTKQFYKNTFLHILVYVHIVHVYTIIYIITYHTMSCHEESCYIDQVKIDTPAPAFHLPAYHPVSDTDTHVSLADMHGKWTVLFFYPADFTFVCPTEPRYS